MTCSTIVRHPRTTKPPQKYNQLRQQVLVRDGWRCQRCGTAKQLEVHHLQFRSAGGSDCEENLITLCARCHRKTHHGH
jgi:5-methylcytosine-specific restriction endonuclease McrA